MKTLLPIVLSAFGVAAQAQDLHRPVVRDPVKIPREPSAGHAVKLDEHLVKIEPSYGSVVSTSANRSAASSSEWKGAADRAREAVEAAVLAPAAVQFDVPAADGALWALGANYKARFDRHGWTFHGRPTEDAPGHQPIHFRLAAARVGEKALPIGAVAPQRDGDRVWFAHPDVVETIALDPNGVEQTFTFRELSERGEIVVQVDVESTLEATHVPAGLRFASPFLEVSYSAAIAIDADGRRVAAETSFTDGRIVMRVPASFVATARLPLVIDPRVASQTVRSDSRDLGSPDIVWDEGAQHWHVVYQRSYAAGDWDCYVQRLDGNLGPVGSPISVDFTTTAWTSARIANLRAYGVSMVVAERRSGTTPIAVVGRILRNDGTAATAQFDIAATSRDSIRPDIGGDAGGAPTYFTVVWEHAFSATDHDVYARQITNDGTLRGTSPIYVQINTGYQSFPTISKANGAPPYALQRWTIAYQQRASSADEDIYGAMLTWDGQLVPAGGGGSTFPIDTSVRSHRYPQASSPSIVDAAGRRRIVVAYEDPSSNAGDILATAIDGAGVALGSVNVSHAEQSPLRLGWTQRAPSIDCDGLRFAVGYHEMFNNTSDLDTRMTLLSVGPNGTFHAAETGAALATSTAPEFNLQVASRYSSSNVANPRYAVANDRDGGSGGAFHIDAQIYDGLSSGSLTRRTTGCGGLLTIGAFGSAVPGGSLSFSINSGNASPGFLVGRAVDRPLAPLCNGCTIGVAGIAIINNLYSLTVPNDPGLIGAQLSVQGFMLTTAGAPCLGQVHLSDTIDVLVQ